MPDFWILPLSLWILFLIASSHTLDRGHSQVHMLSHISVPLDLGASQLELLFFSLSTWNTDHPLRPRLSILSFLKPALLPMPTFPILRIILNIAWWLLSLYFYFIPYHNVSAYFPLNEGQGPCWTHCCTVLGNKAGMYYCCSGCALRQPAVAEIQPLFAKLCTRTWGNLPRGRGALF